MVSWSAWNGANFYMVHVLPLLIQTHRFTFASFMVLIVQDYFSKRYELSLQQLDSASPSDGSQSDSSTPSSTNSANHVPVSSKDDTALPPSSASATAAQPTASAADAPKPPAAEVRHRKN